MGREARCYARWGERRGEVTVLIEPPELIVRGAFRARASLAALTKVRAEHGIVRCIAAGDVIELELGEVLAPRWAAALIAAPPALAKKLGITPITCLWIDGPIDDDELAAALGDSPRTKNAAEAGLLIVRTDDADVLAERVAILAPALARGTPLWVVYVKGKGAPLGERTVRTMLRDRGMIDRKIAAVSERLTALQFARLAEKR
jgi:hypothetical protein